MDYMMLPGFTDQVEEFETLCDFLKETNVDMVQWRNLSIDPEFYLRLTKFDRHGPASVRLRQMMGIKAVMDQVKEKFPQMRFGHYNPCLDPGAMKYKE